MLTIWIVSAIECERAVSGWIVWFSKTHSLIVKTHTITQNTKHNYLSVGGLLIFRGAITFGPRRGTATDGGDCGGEEPWTRFGPLTIGGKAIGLGITRGEECEITG